MTEATASAAAEATAVMLSLMGTMAASPPHANSESCLTASHTAGETAIT